VKPGSRFSRKSEGRTKLSPPPLHTGRKRDESFLIVSQHPEAAAASRGSGRGSFRPRVARAEWGSRMTFAVKSARAHGQGPQSGNSADRAGGGATTPLSASGSVWRFTSAASATA